MADVVDGDEVDVGGDEDDAGGNIAVDEGDPADWDTSKGLLLEF